MEFGQTPESAGDLGAPICYVLVLSWHYRPFWGTRVQHQFRWQPGEREGGPAAALAFSCILVLVELVSSFVWRLCSSCGCDWRTHCERCGVRRRLVEVLCSQRMLHWTWACLFVLVVAVWLAVFRTSVSLAI